MCQCCGALAKQAALLNGQVYLLCKEHLAALVDIFDHAIVYRGTWCIRCERRKYGRRSE